METKCEGCGKWHLQGEPCAADTKPIPADIEILSATVRRNMQLTHGISLGGTHHIEDGIEFREVSIVSAPKCQECRAAMVPATSTHWNCAKDGCSEEGVLKHTGIYPITVVK